MDYTVQEIQFLDLTNADEEECNFLQTTLFTWNPNLNYPELPWATQSDSACTRAEWRPPSYGPGDPIDGCSAVTAVLEGGDGDSAAAQNIPSPAAPRIGDVSQDPQTVGGPGSMYTDPSVMAVPTSVPAPVPPSVMTTMYHHQIMSGLPLSSVYVGNVTANVNVHGYVSAYPHISPQQVYPSEVPQETPNPVRNGGREARRGRSNKPGSKRVDGQYGDRNSSGRHAQEVIQVQPSPLVESPPGNSNLPQQGFPQFFPISPMHHPYQPPYYNPSTPTHPAPHLPHPSAQHATGTPIYLPGHPIYPPPPMYGTYAPHHQPPGAPPIMSFATVHTTPVPTTETSVLGTFQAEGSNAEEQMPTPTGNKEIELGEAHMHRQKLSPSSVCATMFQPQLLPEVCSPSEALASSGHSNTKPVSYQQQQSEEEDFNQTDLVNTVVVSNSNMVTEPPPFIDSKQSGVVDSINRNIPHSTGHNSFIKNDQPKFISEKVAVSSHEVLVDSSVSFIQATRINISETSANESAVVSDLDLKRDAGVVSDINLSLAVEKCHITDMKSPLPHADVLTSAVTAPKLAHGLPEDSVVSFTSNPQPVSTSIAVQHQDSGQNITALPPSSHPIDVPNTAVAMPSLKSWASLFKPSPTIDGMMMATGSPANRTGNKPLACVKPFQNAVPVTTDGSNRVSEGSSALQSVSPAVSPGISTASGDNVNSYSQLPSPSSTDDPHLYQLGELLLKYQLEHKALSLQPRGLTNKSNWCYINSTLQALLACPPFYNLMKALSLPSRRSGKSSTPIIDSMVQFVNEFVPLSPTSRLRDRKEKALRKDDGSIEVQCGAPFEPSYIYKMLNSIRSDTFKVEGRQEDAEEFLGCLLNALNDEMLELIKLVEEPSAKSTLSNGDIATNGDTSALSQDEDDTEWTVMGRKNKGSITRRADFGRTPISDIFRGHLRSRVQRAGDQSTDNVQPFFTLQLDIEKAQSVKDALEILVGRDQLEGVTCSRTNQEVEAWQQVTLEELPLVLLLHLKWFDYKLDGASKIVKCVEFPIDLKVDPKLLSSNKKYGAKQRQYKLFAVVYHDGKEATKGHYITDVFHVGYGGWVRYDDSVVKAVQESNVLRPRGPRVPYLLYYRRCDTIGNISPSLDKTR